MEEDYTKNKLVIGLDKEDLKRIKKGEIIVGYKTVIKLTD